MLPYAVAPYSPFAPVPEIYDSETMPGPIKCNDDFTHCKKVDVFDQTVAAIRKAAASELLMNLSDLAAIEELNYSPNGDYFNSDKPMHHSFMMAELYPHDVWGFPAFEEVPTNLYGHGKEAGPALMQLNTASPMFAAGKEHLDYPQFVLNSCFDCWYPGRYI